MASQIPGKEVPFIETPNGIFTAAGNWFHTTVDDLRDYAGSLLDRRSVASLIHDAELLLRSPVTIALWIAPPLLYYLGIPLTALICFACLLFLSTWGPMASKLGILPLLNILDKLPLQALFYIVILSWYAMNDLLALMAAGLVIFILLRWGLVSKVVQPIARSLHKRLYAVPYEDQILKAVVVRSAMSTGASLPELDEIERFILGRINRKK